MTPGPNEKTTLLPTIHSNPGSSASSEVSSSETDDYDDEQFLTLDKRQNSFAQMKKVVHNPENYESPEDFQTMLGSTSILQNAIDQDIATGETRKRNSFTMSSNATDEEATFADLSSLSFRPMGRSKRSSSFSGMSFREKSVRDNIEEANGNQFIVFSQMQKIYKKQINNPTTLYLKKIKNSFFDDAKSLAEGTIPQSIVLATVIGVVCGIACYVYYSVLYFGLDYLWNVLPEEKIVPSEYWKPEYYWLWYPLVSFVMVTCVGLTVVYMGEPGDLPYTISRVHSEAYIPMNHVSPMVFASIFSILAGGSLGPEAPLVAICGALGGFVSRRIFRQSSTNVVRKHTLMGMAGALAAFFGVPLGGSLFALEVCSR